VKSLLIYFSLYFLIVLIDYRNLIKRKDKKQIIVYSCFTVITILVAIIYYINPLGPSLLESLGKLFFEGGI